MGLIEYKPFGGGLVGCVSWQRPLFLFFFFLSLTSFCSFLQESDGTAVVSGLRFYRVKQPLTALLCVRAFTSLV